ncbi:MAG TPA: hypothetical protein PLC07_04360 [Bacillota bacterium]|nr:hypothetical protein [Bacillota bacterium]HPT86758.1 hypothetical protein [Bacillota bacterium]
MLDRLIEEGEKIRQTCVKEGMMSQYLTGENYEKWIAKCTLS